MRSETLIVEDVMLMLLDDETGVEAGAGTLHYTLGSAVLVELALLGRIDIDEGRAGLNGPEVLAVLGDLYDAGTEAWEPAGVLDACERTLNAVGGVVSTVDPDLFDRPTPCAGWDVRTLLNHLVWENLVWSGPANGVPRLDATADHLGEDHIEAFRSAAQAAFRRPGMLDPVRTRTGSTARRAVDHRNAGPLLGPGQGDRAPARPRRRPRRVSPPGRTGDIRRPAPNRGRLLRSVPSGPSGRARSRPSGRLPVRGSSGRSPTRGSTTWRT
nr:GPP34 family phosphoprotein [Streptomyces sp. NBC_00857]